MSDIGSVFLYIIVFLTAVFFFSFYKSGKKLIRRSGIMISILIPTILAGMRYDVGTDYLNYDYLFTLLRNTTWKGIFVNKFNMEKGFLVLSKMSAGFCNNKTIFAIMAFLITSLFVYTILMQYRNYNLTVCYAVFLFLHLTSSFNILRQYIAVVLIFWGLKYIFENKPLKFILVIIFAMTFHVTAILVFPMWFFWNHKEGRCVNIQIKLSFFVCAILIILNWKVIIRYLLNLNIPFIAKYGGYLIGNETNNRSFYLHMAVALLMMFMTGYFKEHDSKIMFFMYMYVIGTLVEYAGFYVTFVKRIGLYYMFPSVLIWGMFERAFAGKLSKRIINALICAVEISYFVVSAFILKQGRLVPYRWN